MLDQMPAVAELPCLHHTALQLVFEPEAEGKVGGTPVVMEPPQAPPSERLPREEYDDI